MHKLYALTDEGDSQTKWDPTDAEAVAIATEKFEEYKRRGYTALNVTHGERLDAFDPTVPETVLIPQRIGG